MTDPTPPSRPFNVSRRSVLKGLGALILGVSIPPLAEANPGATPPSPPPTTPTQRADLNAFVGISEEGLVTVLIPSSEMGQGASTGLAQCVAEELDVPWERIRVAYPEEGRPYRFVMLPGDPRHMTGGSISVRTWYMPMRQAGAAAKAMLVAAAAKRWGVKAEGCISAGGVVSHPSGQRASYGELARDAAKERPPRCPKLKDAAEFKIIGESVPREDLLGKVTGGTVYGVDVRLPGMLRACVVASPVVGGRVISVDESAARATPGVVDILVFEDFVAVVAKTWWPAKRGVSALDIQWDEGPNQGLEDADVSRVLDDLLAAKGATRARKHGQALARIDEAEAEDILEATYEVPFVDHAPMEPLNCTVDLKKDRCDIWIGTQAQTLVQRSAKEITGLKDDQIHVHTVYLGGGFGRRGQNDFGEMTLKIAKRLKAPVQLLWTREETTRHGYYRPAMKGRFRASIKGSRLEALHGRVVGDDSGRLWLPPILTKFDKMTILIAEGLSKKESPYDYDNVLIETATHHFGINVGYWRSVGHSYTSFFRESFLDEVAHHLREDPLTLRLGLLNAERPRFRVVLERVAVEAGWGQAPKGRYQGIAIQESFGSICAQVVEISLEGGRPRVQKVTAVVDCGRVVNPDQVKAQIMGGSIFGLSSALGEKITLAQGRVLESNFHDYKLMRMNESPLTVDVHIIHNPHEPPGGVGEPGTPPAVPALCNAIFAATGRRIRRLPINAALAEEA